MMFEANIEQAHYGNIVALQSINLKVDSGQIVCILGANGAGKTTTIQSIIGIVDAKKREINIKNNSVTKFPTWQLTQFGIGYAPDAGLCFENISVQENLKSIFLLNKKYIKEKDINKLLNEVYELFPRLKERKNQLAGTLSGGERKMLAIGRVLMLDPSVMLLDEPSSGLAPIMVQELFKSIYEIKKRGKVAIILAEQNAKICLDISDNCLLMDLGNIVMEDSPSNLINNDKFTKAYFGI